MARSSTRVAVQCILVREEEVAIVGIWNGSGAPAVVDSSHVGTLSTESIMPC
jgi:hypothetical protein